MADTFNAGNASNKGDKKKRPRPPVLNFPRLLSPASFQSSPLIRHEIARWQKIPEMAENS